MSWKRARQEQGAYLRCGLCEEACPHGAQITESGIHVVFGVFLESDERIYRDILFT